MVEGAGVDVWGTNGSAGKPGEGERDMTKTEGNRCNKDREEQIEGDV
jgi:hypothetical protein